MHSSCLKFFGCCSGPKQESAPVKNWRASYATSLRGNLVRTYKTPIDDDYYIDNDHELGKGGCGVVVVGEHKETHAQYAIKIVNKSTAERGRLDRELKLLKDVDHANIVRLFSLYDLPTHMYFVMELCLGGHLGNLLSRQASKCVDEDWGRKLARQLVSAVAHIHSRGIAHRDIKLQNILIDNCTDRTAQLKLIDFGYGSRYIGALPMKTKCGTPYTTAPEVIRECYDERCDVWSMGVVIYIMLCGRRPFEALDIPGPLADAGKASMITNILAGRYHFNHKAWLNVSKAGIAFVKTLLHPDYKTRIHSHEALEVPWLSDGTVMSAQASMLKSAKSFHAVSNMKKNTEASEMQRTGMVALVFGINSKAATDLRNVFQSFDYDGSGMLSRVEFEKALHEISPELSSADINHLFDIVDLDKNKQISYSEFLAATLDPNEVDIDELSKAFKLLDEDGNGYITKDELRKVLTFQYEQAFANHHTLTSGAVRRNSRDLRNIQSEALHRVVEEKIVHIFEQVDVNNDGVISHSEFLCAMTGLDFYLDGSEGLFGEEEDEQDYEGDNEQPSNPHEKFTPPPTHKQFSESLYGGVGSNKFQNMDLADVTNNEYAYVPERDGDDVLEDVESVSVKSPGGPFASDKPVLGQPDVPATSGAAMHSRIRDLVNSGSNGVYSSPVQSQRNTLISKQQSTNRMQLEPIADNSHSTGDKMSRQSSVRSNHPVLKQGSSKINIHGVPAINLPPSSGSDNSGGGAPVAYTGILSHHKRDDSTYMRPLSGNANKADTFVVEASPRRGIPTDMPGGNLAFYGVQESIDVVKEDDTSSSSYGATKIATLFGSPPLKPQISKRSFDTEGGEKDRSISPKTGRSSKTSSFAPPKLNPSGSFKNNAPLSSPYRSRPSATDLQFTDINKSRDDEDRPTDLRASFALKGRAPSYRNTTIMDSSSENIKVLVEDAQGGAAASTAEENGAAAAERNALSRKVSRPGMPTFAAHNSDTDVALVEPAAPPPMLRAGSKAFSFKKLQDASGTSRPGTSRQGGDDDFYGSSDQRGNDFQSPDTNGLKGMASPMLGSIKKMLSVGKLNQNK